MHGAQGAWDGSMLRLALNGRMNRHVDMRLADKQLEELQGMRYSSTDGIFATRFTPLTGGDSKSNIRFPFASP